MIELTEPKYGTQCNHCFSKEDVKEIGFLTDGQGVIVRLCAKCRKELAGLLNSEMRCSNCSKCKFQAVRGTGCYDYRCKKHSIWVRWGFYCPDWKKKEKK